MKQASKADRLKILKAIEGGTQPKLKRVANQLVKSGHLIFLLGEYMVTENGEAAIDAA